MAISKDKQQEILKELKAKQAKKAKKMGQEVESKKEETDSDELQKLRNKVTDLTNKVEEEREKNAKLVAGAGKKEKDKKYMIERDAVNDILFGNENRIFKKTYAYKVKNSENAYEFNIELHMPSALELGQIASDVSKFLKDSNIDNPTQQVIDLFTAIANFKVCADVCPEWFKDPKKAYRWDIILDVYSEVMSWQDSFYLPQEK